MLRPLLVSALLALAAISCAQVVRGAEAPPAPDPARSIALFDGRTLAGWEGAPGLWRVEAGAIVGGTLRETVKQNEFLATTRRFTNFILRARFRLTGTGFVNSGVQLRSERVPGSSEMAGYQCDLGDPAWWGSLYDESRRNRVLAWSDLGAIERVLRRDDWNEYVIRADGARLTTWINGALGIDYFEPDEAILRHGRIGFQVHGGGATEAWFQDVTIEELPGAPRLAGAAEPPAPPHGSPLTAEEQQATFSVPPGFRVELVAAEPDGGKFVAIQFDHAGRMWAMTALEYPLDANEAGAEARALFARGGRDRVLVFDTPTAPGRQQPRTFADRLVMPLGVLPYRDGAYVQYGTEIRHYYDLNGDGVADGHTNVLTGFGIEDSHLFPHQFTRAPGGWFWLAQGAFNYSKVATPAQEVTEFNRTKLARWRPDGSRFETIGWGPCNIWGLVIDRLGEVFIQEANDQGWPLMPFLEGGSYPLCGEDVPRPYVPPFPKTGEREMGGTGLSGLALSEGADSFPGAWRDVFFVNNPITRKVQAIRVHRGGRDGGADAAGNGWQLEHLPDFVLSSDPWFRPVAMAFGPDGCLYVVDWYNQIISHNEVPRAHPERDKTRGRVWRIRHESQAPRLKLPDLYRAPEAELVASLGAANTWEANAAWQEITDRPAPGTGPALARIVQDEAAAADRRLRALWSLEGLRQLDLAQLDLLLRARPRAVRKEALRALAAGDYPADQVFAYAGAAVSDPDRLVVQEAIRAVGRVLDRVADSPAAADRALAAQATAVLVHAGAGAAPGDWARNPAFFRDFERYLVRLALERHRPATIAFLEAAAAGRAHLPPASRASPVAARAFAAVALGDADGARHLAALLPALARGLTAEELLLVASAPADPAAGAALREALGSAANLRLLYDRRGGIPDHAALAPVLVEAARGLVARDGSDANHALLVQLATGFKLAGLEAEVITAATRPGAKPDAQLAALRALRESGSVRLDILRRFVASGDDAVRREAVTALAAARTEAAVPALLEAWPGLTPALRRTAVGRLAGSVASARQLVAAIGSGAIARDELDGESLDKLATVLPDDAAVKQLVAELGSALQPVLRLDGADGDYVDTELTLDGPFTVETWVRLDPGINNEDSILGAPGVLDANFYDRRFRVWVAGANDVVVATRPAAPDAWTHVAFTRDAAGVFRLYLDGELDSTGPVREPRRFEHLVPGRSNPAGGTAGEFAEYRVWKACRTPDEIRAGANLALGAADGGPDLLYHGGGAAWGRLHGGARITRTADFPPIETAAARRGLEEKFARFRALAATPGDAARGQQVFTTTCAVCHPVKGQGGRIGPALDGAGAHGLDSVLRNVLTPNAAMEAGYRRYRVETREGDVLEGLLAGQDADSVTLRQPNTEDQRFARTGLKRAGFVRGSVMPEGLLEGLPPADVTDLLTYVLTLK